MTFTKDLNMGRKFLTWLLLLLFANTISVIGCGRKETSKNERPSPSTEKREKERGVMNLSLEKQKAYGIETQQVVPESISVPLSATAVIEFNADRVSKISSRVTGKTTMIMASQGDRVKAGQPLAYIDTVDLGQAWSEYAKAKSKQELALSNLKREETLFEKKISPEKDVLKARNEFREAEADLTFSREKFRLLGIDLSQMEIEKNYGGGNNHPLVQISAVIDGVVIEKHVTQGEVVSPEKVLFIVSDVSSLWVVIDVYEKDLSRIRTGVEAKLHLAAYPATIFKGRISYVGDVMDEKTRTMKARVTIDNRGGLLKPGMFATVSIDSVRGSRAEKIIAVPDEAVFLDGSERYVFLREGDGKFVVRRVSVGTASGQKIEIKEGLKAGDTLVTQGVFALKSELKKEMLHADEH